MTKERIALGTVAAITAQLLRDSENLSSDGDLLVYMVQARQFKENPKNMQAPLPMSWKYHENRVRELAELAFLICDTVQDVAENRN